MSDVSHAEIARQDWSRTLVVGGLGTLDIQEVNAHMNALLTTSKQRPKCVMFTRGKGVGVRIPVWAMNEGIKYASFSPQLKSENIFDIFSRGRPTAVLIFPGVPVIGQVLLAKAKKKGLFFLDVDDLHERISPKEEKRLAQTLTSYGKAVWKETEYFGQGKSKAWEKAEEAWKSVFGDKS